MLRKILGLALYLGCSASAAKPPIAFPTLRLMAKGTASPHLIYRERSDMGTVTVIFPLDNEGLGIATFESLAAKGQNSAGRPLVFKQSAIALYFGGEFISGGYSASLDLVSNGGALGLKGSVTLDGESHDEATGSYESYSQKQEIDLKKIPVFPANASYREVLKEVRSIPGLKKLHLKKASR